MRGCRGGRFPFRPGGKKHRSVRPTEREKHAKETVEMGREGGKRNRSRREGSEMGGFVGAVVKRRGPSGKGL